MSNRHLFNDFFLYYHQYICIAFLAGFIGLHQEEGIPETRSGITMIDETSLKISSLEDL